LPKNIQKQPEIANLIGMQRALENFTLQSMFTVVAKSIELLSDLSGNDVYDMNGQFDPFRLQSILATQQHVMNVIAAFNTHCRRLPIVIQDMLRDLEVFTIVDISKQNDVDKQVSSGFITATPMATFLNQAVKAKESEFVEHTEVTNNECHDIELKTVGPVHDIDQDEPLEEV
jgi:hypothetical protein